MPRLFGKVSLRPLFFNSMFLLFVCALTLLIPQTSFAQKNIVDSLQILLSDVTSDVERQNLLQELTDESINIDLSQALAYAEESLELARSLGDEIKEAHALYKMGQVLYETKDRSKSLAYFEESEQLAIDKGLGELQARNLMSMGRYYRYATRDSVKTVESFLKSAAISKKNDFHWGTGRSYAKLASFYTGYNQVGLCEEYLQLAAKYYSQVDNGKKTIAHYYTEVGDKIWSFNPKKSMDLYFTAKEYSLIPNLMVSLAKAHSFIGDYEVALNYLEQAIPFFRKTEKRKRMLGIAISQLTETLIKFGDFQTANQYCEEGIKILKNVGRSDQKALPSLYRSKAMLLEQKGMETEALNYYKLSIEVAKKIKNANGRIYSTLALGLFYAKDNLKNAKIFCERSLKESRQGKYINLEIKSCECLHEIYKAEGDFEQALLHFERKDLLSDSLSIMNIGHALEINNKITEKDKLIAEQSYQKKIKEKELKNQHILNSLLIAIVIFGVLLIGILARNNYRVSRKNKKINEISEEMHKTNRRLAQSNQELERFAHIASHDLKTPIRSIVSFTTLLRHRLKTQENPDVWELLDFIEKGGKNMNQLIEDVLEYSRLSGKESLKEDWVDLNKLTNELAQLMQETKDAQSITFEIAQLPHVLWYHSHIYLLFKNLIENGIKYNKSTSPTIKIDSKITEDVHFITITDNGIGIQEQYFESIFTMFNRLHNQSEYEGTGLGLATCKKIVEEFEGKISVSSQVDKGTVFTIEIPSDMLLYNKKDIPVVKGQVLNEV